MAVKYNGRFIGVDKTPAYNNINGVWTLDQAAASAGSYDWPQSSLTYVTDSLQVYLDAGISSSYPGSGTTWTDISGNNRNFTLVSSPTFSTDYGGHFDLNGTSQYFSSTFNTNYTTAITVAVWIAVNSKQLGGDGGNYFVVSKNSSYAASQTDFPVCISGLPGTIGFTLGDGSSFNAISATANPYNNCDKWAYFVGVYDKVSVRAYVNGVLSATTNNTTNISSNSQNWTIGRPAQFYAGPMNTYYRGKLGSFALYSKALSQAEITQNFNYGRGRFNV